MPLDGRDRVQPLAEHAEAIPEPRRRRLRGEPHRAVVEPRDDRRDDGLVGLAGVSQRALEVARLLRDGACRTPGDPAVLDGGQHPRSAMDECRGVLDQLLREVLGDPKGESDLRAERARDELGGPRRRGTGDDLDPLGEALRLCELSRPPCLARVDVALRRGDPVERGAEGGIGGIDRLGADLASCGELDHAPKSTGDHRHSVSETGPDQQSFKQCLRRISRTAATGGASEGMRGPRASRPAVPRSSGEGRAHPIPSPCRGGSPCRRVDALPPRQRRRRARDARAGADVRRDDLLRDRRRDRLPPLVQRAGGGRRDGRAVGASARREAHRVLARLHRRRLPAGGPHGARDDAPGAGRGGDGPARARVVHRATRASSRRCSGARCVPGDPGAQSEYSCSGAGYAPETTSATNRCAAAPSTPRRSAYCCTNFGTRPFVRPAQSVQTMS